MRLKIAVDQRLRAHGRRLERLNEETDGGENRALTVHSLIHIAMDGHWRQLVVRIFLILASPLCPRR